jgi:hypothetical protein
VTPPQIPGTRVRSRRNDAAWEVRVDRLQDLRRLTVASVDCASIDSVEVTVNRWHAPASGWLGSPRVPGVTAVEVAPKSDGVRLRLSLAQKVDAAVLLAGCVRILMPVARDVGPMLTFAPGLPASAGILAGHLHDTLSSGEQRDAHVRRADILVLPDGDPVGADPNGPEREATVRIGDGSWTRNDLLFSVCVDPAVHRPVGRRSTGATTVATASVTGGVVTLESAEGKLVVGRSVTASSTRALRSIGAVTSTDLSPTVTRQLNACGVLVTDDADSLPVPEDDLEWQVRSVHDRRHALRQYGPTPTFDAWPTVSIVVVTHRSDFLDHLFAQLRGLSYPRLEVIFGLHGNGVDAVRAAELAADLQFPVTFVDVDAAATLGEALQRCSDRAEGALITKMDDDDYYGAEHIWDLVLARQYSGAEIVGKTLDWIHLVSSDVTVFRPTYPAEKYADFVAGGTMLISRADLGEVGGWRPVPKSVDRALLDRVLADGGLVYRTHGLGYIYVRRSSGHTAAVKDEHFLKKVAHTYDGLLRHEAFGTHR